MGEQWHFDTGESLPIAGELDSRWMGGRARGYVVWVPSSYSASAFQKIEQQTPSYWLKLTDAKKAEEVKAVLARDFIFVPREGDAVGSVEGRAMRLAFHALGVFALALGLYLMFQLFSALVVERTREVALYHAIGITRRYMAGVFLWEAVPVGQRCEDATNTNFLAGCSSGPA